MLPVVDGIDVDEIIETKLKRLKFKDWNTP